MGALIADDMVRLDGLDAAIVGTADCQKFSESVLAYSEEKIIEILQHRDGMNYREAIDFFLFNILSLGVEKPPVFVHKIDPMDITWETQQSRDDILPEDN